MADTLFLSRLSLRRDAALAALAPVLAPEDDDSRVDLGHRLLWSVFSDGPDRRRDFLWREEELGRYLALSKRRPPRDHPFFTVETKAFEPRLKEGDRLRIALRANIVATRKDEARNNKRRDVVLEALREYPKDDYALHRDRLAKEAASAWLDRQGEKSGFRVDALDDCAYRKSRVPRRGAPDVTLGVFDIEGRLTVASPSLFVEALANGFGKAKCFGCGLMLIRRTR